MPERFTSEHDIMAAINETIRRANRMKADALALDIEADRLFAAGLGDDGRFKRNEAEKMRASAERVNGKAKHLGELLAEFRTQAMPFLTDTSVEK